MILGKWLRGQLLLIALVAAVAYIGLGPVLHLPYALALAVLTGILEIIPLIGPLIATAIVAVDAFARGGVRLAAAVIVFYFVLRQVEDQVVMPVVIGRAVHLHPIVTIFAVLVGLSVYGVLGGLLGVPSPRRSTSSSASSTRPHRARPSGRSARPPHREPVPPTRTIAPSLRRLRTAELTPARSPRSGP